MDKLPTDFTGIIERLKKNGIDTITDRWSKGIPHHPESIKLVRELADVDFNLFNDYFCWKIGGDGDNGECLAYMLDLIFELRDKEKAVKQG